MDKIAPLSQRALMQSAPQSKAQVTKASRIAEKILSAYPDYGKAPDGYLLSVTEFIAYQLPEVQDALMHPTMGIATKCKYLPTIADLKQFIEDRAKRLNVRSTVYKYFPQHMSDPVDMASLERRKAQVLAELGYDPSLRREQRMPPLDPAIRDAIENYTYSLSMLKSPQGPPSPELLKVLDEQGYFGSKTEQAA